MTMKKTSSPKKPSNRIKQILRIMENSYPDAECTLRHSNSLELLIATILSAQCTDERVNIVTRDLFRKYTTAEDYAHVPREDLEKDIQSTGFYRNKAKSIQGACLMILDAFGGMVPDTMEELVKLPGVARKTANVVLGVAFGKAGGIVVDTHVFRVARRLGLSASDTAEKVERDLIKIIPKKRWIKFSHQVILHGRKICKARKPLCGLCPLEKICNSDDKTLS
jgi:endonuclease-3